MTALLLYPLFLVAGVLLALGYSRILRLQRQAALERQQDERFRAWLAGLEADARRMMRVMRIEAALPWPDTGVTCLRDPLHLPTIIGEN
jgi:hypothetical protein